MLKATNQVVHTIFQPVIYEITSLNLTLLPTEVQQHLNEATGITKICQADSPTKPDGTTVTYWQFYAGDSLLPTEILEGTQVAENFLANCLL